MWCNKSFKALWAHVHACVQIDATLYYVYNNMWCNKSSLFASVFIFGDPCLQLSLYVGSFFFFLFLWNLIFTRYKQSSRLNLTIHSTVCAQWHLPWFFRLRRPLVLSIPLMVHALWSYMVVVAVFSDHVRDIFFVFTKKVLVLDISGGGASAALSCSWRGSFCLLF